VVVDAGATWSEVVAVTLQDGLTPPVLPDYLDLSVGGTLVVGGIGGTTAACGSVSDNVLALEVVTGHGETVLCAAGDELFDAVLAGLGQAGVITRATLQLVAAPRWVRRCTLAYPDLPSMLGDARSLLGRFHVVQGAILPAPGGGFAFGLDVARWFDAEPPDDRSLLAGLSDDGGRREATTTTYRAFLGRLAPLETALRANGQWSLPHPWLMTFVGDAQVESVVGSELERLDPAADLGPLGQLALSPLRRAAISSPLLRLPDEELSWAFNFVRLPANGDASCLVDANAAAYARIRAGGGTLYPVSALPLSPADWKEHFGEAFDRLEAAKRRFDPARRLTPGYEVFA
jgi:cytokinin dehydrogenase